MSRFCSLETVIKKVITLEGQFPNCFYGLCSLIFQSVCLNTGLCHGNFPIGFNIVALVPLLPDSVFYPVPDFLQRSTESSDPLLMFVIQILSGCSVQEKWEFTNEFLQSACFRLFTMKPQTKWWKFIWEIIPHNDNNNLHYRYSAHRNPKYNRYEHWIALYFHCWVWFVFNQACKYKTM